LLAKVVLLKVLHPLKVYHNTELYSSTFTGASFASTSEVWMSVIFGMVVVTGLEIMAKTLPSMA
jgi:hypothetical protein